MVGHAEEAGWRGIYQPCPRGKKLTISDNDARRLEKRVELAL